MVSVEGDPAQTKPRFSLNADDPSSIAASATPEEDVGQGIEGGGGAGTRRRAGMGAVGSEAASRKEPKSKICTAIRV